MMREDYKSGFAALVGRPNVGDYPEPYPDGL